MYTFHPVWSLIFQKMETSLTGARGKTTHVKTHQYKCPCQTDKTHLGVFAIEPKETEVLSELCKVQKEFYIGHGIKTNDSNNCIEHNSFLLKRLFVTLSLRISIDK